jgi:hypothetical protein
MILLVFLGFGIVTYRGAEEIARAEVTALGNRAGQGSGPPKRSAANKAGLPVDLLSAHRSQHLARTPWTKCRAHPSPKCLPLPQSVSRQALRPERVMDLLRLADNPRRCEGRPIIRRFAAIALVAHPLPMRPSFLDGLLRITIAIPGGAEDVARLADVSVTSSWNGRFENLTGLPQRVTIPLGNLELDTQLQ